MNCDEVRQNAAAYALGALTDEEIARFEAHIIECDLEHEVAAFADVTSRLVSAVPVVEPPAGLRSKIMAAASGAEQGSAAPEQSTVRETGGPRLRTTRSALPSYVPEPLRRFSATAYGAAAAVLVVGILIGWGIAALGGDSAVTDLRHFHRDGDGDWLRVEAEIGSTGTMLSVGNLDPLDNSGTYQFWAIRGERWLPVGDFNTNPEGRWQGYFEFALEDGDSIAITIEPSGGSSSPSAEPEIRSNI